MQNNEFTSSVLDFPSQQAMFASIVRFSEDAIVSKTLQGEITSWNHSAERLFGYRHEEVIGKHISLLIPENRLAEEADIVRKIIKGEYVGKFRTVRLHKQGHELHVSLTISPIRDHSGNIIGSAKIARDIAAEIALEEKLMQNNLELQRSNIYKDEVIGILAHELRTPLTTLKACIQLSRNSPTHSGELIDKAEEQVNHIAHMLTDLLDITKIQAGQLVVNKVVSDVYECIKKAVWIVQQSSPSHILEYDHNAHPIFISADVFRIEQVMINLLSNAVKYSPGADKVVVQVKRLEEEVEISIRDFGLGIPADELEKIWTRFYRVKAHKNKINGLGMGLHICKKLVAAHNGSIWAESTENRGTTFFVRLPVTPRPT